MKTTMFHVEPWVIHFLALLIVVLLACAVRFQ